MAEIDKEAARKLHELHYLGCSRARTQLVILVSEDLDEELKQQLLDGAENKTGMFG